MSEFLVVLIWEYFDVLIIKYTEEFNFLFVLFNFLVKIKLISIILLHTYTFYLIKKKDSTIKAMYV